MSYIPLSFLMSCLTCAQVDGGKATSATIWRELHGPFRGIWIVDFSLTRRLNPTKQDLHKLDELLRPSDQWTLMDGRHSLSELPPQEIAKLQGEKFVHALLVSRQVLDIQTLQFDEQRALWVLTEPGSEGTSFRLRIYPYIPTEKVPKPGPASHDVQVTLHYLPIEGHEPLLIMAFSQAHRKGASDFYLVLQRIRLLPDPQKR
ncbi:MAG: hypothetical protein RMI91_15130 [Gemmatales bacterium]|nr:hypothetical protein [Gemmatales bacterium]MDW7995978.1 hypothetical protein [Gemmatales bacterium]